MILILNSRDFAPSGPVPRAVVFWEAASVAVKWRLLL